MTSPAVRKKTVFLSHLHIKESILPRQARDRHKENSKTGPVSLRHCEPRGFLLRLGALLAGAVRRDPGGVRGRPIGARLSEREAQGTKRPEGFRVAFRTK